MQEFHDDGCHKGTAKMGGVCRVFDSMGEFIEYAAAELPGDDDSYNRASRRVNDGEGFNKTRTFAEAVALATEGWAGVRDEVDILVRNAVDNFRHDVLIETLSPTMSVDGGAVDMDMYVEGVPECMIQFQPQMEARAGRVVTVLIDACFNSHVQADTVLKRGASITALLESLSLLNHNTEVWVECSVDSYGRDGQRSASYLVKVKDEREAFDINAIMFAVAHPDWLRRLVFSAMEHESPGRRRQFGFSSFGGYGSALGLRASSRVNPTVIVEAPRGFSDPAIAMPSEWLKNTLSGIGLEMQ